MIHLRKTFFVASLFIASIIIALWPYLFEGLITDGEEVWSLLHLFAADRHSDFAFSNGGGLSPSLVSLTHPILHIERLFLELFDGIGSFYLGNKILVAAAAFGSCLLFSRIVLRAPLPLALAMSAYFIVSIQFTYVDTIKHFYSFAIIPLAPCIVLGRMSVPVFLTATLAFDILFAAAASPFHASMAGLAGAAAIQLFTKQGRWGRFAVLWLSYVVIEYINWSEPLSTFKFFYLLSEHDQFFFQTHYGLHPVLSSAYHIWRKQQPLSWMVPAGLVIMVLTDRRRLPHAIMAMVCFVLPMAHRMVQFKTILPPLGFLDSLHTEEIGYGYPLLIFAFLTYGWRRVAAFARMKRLRQPSVWIMAVAVLFCFHTKRTPLLNELVAAKHVGPGSDPAWTFAQYPWRFGLPDDLQRTVTYPCKLHPFLPNVFGLETFDGPIATFPLAGTTALWRGIWPKMDQNDFMIASPPEACDAPGQSIDLAEVNFPILAFMNVKYVLSVVPVRNRDLTLWRKLDIPLYGKNGATGTVYVYALAQSLPRAYMARSVEATSPPALAEMVGRALSDRTAYIPDGQGFMAETENSVEQVERIANGYRITLSSDRGGTVVVNHRLIPPWHATGSDGRSLALAAANLYHMAVMVPAGQRRFTIVYDGNFFSLRGKLAAAH